MRFLSARARRSLLAFVLIPALFVVPRALPAQGQTAVPESWISWGTCTTAGVGSGGFLPDITAYRYHADSSTPYGSEAAFPWFRYNASGKRITSGTGNPNHREFMTYHSDEEPGPTRVFTLPTGYFLINEGLSWSPDGTKIAVRAQRLPDLQQVLFIVDDVGGGAVTSAPVDIGTPDLVPAGEISWGPTGILSYASTGATVIANRYKVVTFPPTGGAATVVADLPSLPNGTLGGPRWLPSGGFAYVKGQQVIVGSTAVTQINPTGSLLEAFAVSPDGQWLATSWRYRDPSTGINLTTLFASRLDGSQLKKLDVGFDDTQRGCGLDWYKYDTGPSTVVPEIIVNSNSDVPDNDLTKALCDTGNFVFGAPECTLRAALETAARSTTGAHITFNIVSTPTISVGSPLPVMTTPVVLDATTQPSGKVKIVGSAAVGLEATKPVTIKGLGIEGFGIGIKTSANTPGSVFTGNTIVTASDGIAGIAAGGNSSTIGGSGALGNDISTRAYGILAAPGSVVSGNSIGRTAANSVDAPIHGIIIAGFDGATGPSDARVADNIVTAKVAGIWIAGTAPAGTVVEGNKVGITSAGTEGPIASSEGILVDGTPRAVVRRNNVNAFCGVQINGSDRSGRDANGALFAESCRESLSTDAPTAIDVEVTGNTIGLLPDGDTPTRTFASRGISLRATSGTKVRDNLVARADTGIEVLRGSGQELTGNKINVNTGVTRTYPDAYPNNMQSGINIDGGADVVIGVVGAGNTIGGTDGAITMKGRASLGVTITANTIGVGTGDVALGNGFGIIARGGEIKLDSNVVAASTKEGIWAIDVDGLTVVNNTVGLNAAKSLAMPNGRGIVVEHLDGTGSKRNTIGPGNVVSGNTGTAISVNGATDVKVTSNLIGTNTAGAALPNGGGLAILATTAEVVDNTIAANTGASLDVSGADLLTMTGNRIGVASTGATLLANGDGALVRRIKEATISDNTIGGGPTYGIQLEAVKKLHFTANRVGVAGAGSTVVANKTGASFDGIDAGEVTDNTFSGNTAEGLWLHSVNPSLVVERNRFGVSVDGSRAVANGVGLRLSGAEVKVGKSNVISGNRGAGVYSEADVATLSESLIGVASNGSTAIPNGDGVSVIRGALTMRTNTVANSTANGVKVAVEGGADLLGNRIYNNINKGIVDPHHAAPVLAAAPRKGTGDDTTTWLVISGLSGITTGRMEAYANLSCDNAQGRTPVASLLLPDPLKSGDGLVWPIHGQPDQHFFTVTVTIDGKTTAFSNCLDADANATDTDGDGVPDRIEAILGGGAESDPKAVAVPVEGKGWITVQGTGALHGVGTVEDPSPTGHPGIDLPFGVLSFTVTPDAAGKAKVSITTQSATADAYWKYGPASSGASPSWYRFDVDPATGTGATRTVGTNASGSFTRFELSFVDGARGDSDGRRNGTIVDPGGPAVTSGITLAPPTLTGTPPAGTVGSAYSFPFSTTGSPTPTVTSEGSLPPGLELSATGLLSGTPTTAGSYAFTVIAANGVEPAARLAVRVDVTPAVIVTPPTPTADVLYAPSVVPPSSIAIGATYAVETAQRVNVLCDGSISGIWWYRVATDTGINTVSVWNGSTLLARAKGTPTSTGWVLLSFAAPLTVRAGDQLLVSVHHPNGSYAYRLNGFANRVVNSAGGCLVAPASASGDASGRYSYTAAPALPTLSYAASEYFISPAFTTGENVTTTTTIPTLPVSIARLYASSVVPPSTLAIGPTYAVETAQLIDFSCSGQVKGIWWYRVAQDTGINTVTAWKGTTAVASGSGDPGTTGWSFIAFTEPVTVRAGDRLLLGVHHRNGAYGTRVNGFASRAVQAGCLSSPASTPGAPNGRYAYSGTPVLPTLSYAASEYFISPDFAQTAG